mmetsp:Transcript_31496/g.55208  ORF Transcript_31496/g.55208 Transcript_31496/m.55208 type:complete len:85 (-) Transcript_31496:94-348(-)
MAFRTSCLSWARTMKECSRRYLHLSRLGTNCESLPKPVLFSPSMRDSSVLDDDAAEEERFLISVDEEAFLRQELARFRRGSVGE